MNRLQVAKAACYLAADIQKGYLSRKDFGISTKSNDKDLVTEADKACDVAIVQHLRAHFPHDAFVTEESFVEGQTLPMHGTWVIDPVDGTTNFAHGFPHFAVSIAYVEEGEPVLGLIYDTMKDQLFWAEKGQGAWCNQTRIHVSDVTQLSLSLLSTGFPSNQSKHQYEANLRLFTQFMRSTHGVRRAGSAALDLAYVAAGYMDGFWEPQLSPWDVAAGILLVEEAGGLTCDFQRQRLDLTQRRINILATNNQAILSAMLDLCMAESFA
jgi:myo-inositol-1(or 4)-monophosphatase